MPGQITNIKKLQKKSLALKVTPTADLHTFGVQSGSDPQVEYIVTFAPGYHEATCTCPWMQNGGNVCSHVMAAVRWLARQNGHQVSFWLTEEEAKRQHRRMTMLNGIWVTSRKREEPKSIATYVCPGCGDEIIAAPGRVVYCWFCWFDSGYRERLLCQEQMERAA